MCPSHFITVIFVITVTLTIVTDITSAAMLLPCRRCKSQQECDTVPAQLCIWGEHRDYCGRRVCSKGPGEKCGDKFNILGVCGEGLWCSHASNRCHGCYIPTMDCFK